MMRFLFFLLILTSNVYILLGQNISGVINNYAVVNTININVLQVSTTNGFNIGDKVMIIKMKGATINQTNSPAYGDTISLNEAGKYIFSFIIAKDAIANTLTLSPFCDVFANDSFLQVVTVPIYPSPTITGTLTCPNWDGFTGGILIFETPGTLTFNSNINTSHKGFRGGDVWGSTFSCGSLNYFSAQAFFGPEGKKGESVADWVLGQECGKGKLAGGGGGAYSGNTGAGGGGNGGKGGDGGFEYNGCIPNPLVYSVGGLSINHIPTKLIPGSGGGGPQADNAQQVYNGGNGGAIVFIKANEIVGNGFFIVSAGESPPQINDEGAPGGGAGGSVYLVCPTFTTNLSINVQGGNGASNFNQIFTTNCHGPGGGGGGGLVWFSNAATPPGVVVNALGGSAGLILNPASACFNTTYNAQNGSNGTVKYNFVPTPIPVPPTINIGGDTTICANSTLTLNAGAGFQTYLWDDMSTNQTRVVNTPGTYHVTVTTFDGCTASDTINVWLDTMLKAIFTADLHLGCIDDTIFLTNLSTGATSYNWLFGDGGYSSFQNPVPYVYFNQGTWTIRLIAFNGPCSDTAYQTININHSVLSDFMVSNVNQPPHDTVCLGTPFTLTTTVVNDPLWTHEWNMGDGSPIQNIIIPALYLYTQPGAYDITHIVTDTLGCKDTTIRSVFVDGQQTLSFTASDTNVCVGDPVYFVDNMSPNVTQFSWDFADGKIVNNMHNVHHSWDRAGVYVVSLTANTKFCPAKNTNVTITVNDYPNISLGPDTAICPGVTGSILLTDLNNPAAIHTWSTGEISNSIVVTEPGRYWVKGSNNGCTTVDSIWIKRDCYINIPNTFSPNGDGLNDYFLPRELLSSGLTAFNMHIFNRWGELIFTTSQIDGRGWDGKYNGVPQPMGVYVYLIETTFANGIKKSFKGNVTLIR